MGTGAVRTVLRCRCTEKAAGEAAEPAQSRGVLHSAKRAQKLFQKTVYREQQNYPLGYKLLCYANHRQPLLLNYTLQFPAAAVDANSCCVAETQQKPPSIKGRAFSLPKGAVMKGFPSCYALGSEIIPKDQRLPSPLAFRSAVRIQALTTFK